MKILVTGSAGFIGAYLCHTLHKAGRYELAGVDSFNAYYDPALKRARIEHLAVDMVHHPLDISDSSALADLLASIQPEVVIHLAAQAGVRHSFNAPMDYARSNLTGQLSLLEAIRHCPSVRRLIYASSSSVYSGIDTLPFVEDLTLATPKSLYAATKIADEILTATYSRLFGLDAIGLRFFTVYGPWGRPDMAYWKFADAILEARPIQLYNFGDVRRDFTYIDDVTAVIERMVGEVADNMPADPSHRIYNIGNHSPRPVADMISILEQQLGRTARTELAPLPPGDMVETFANVERLERDYAYSPSTPLETGLQRFSSWFLDWRARQE